MQQTPTRTEMDEVQREVYDLRRRLRVLERSGIAAAVPHAASPSAAKKAGRSRGAKRTPPNSTA